MARQQGQGNKVRDSGEVTNVNRANRTITIGKRKSAKPDIIVQFNTLGGVRFDKDDSIEFDVDDSSGKEVASNFRNLTKRPVKPAPDVSLSYGTANDTPQGVTLAVWVSVKRNAKLEPGLTVLLMADNIPVTTPIQIPTTNSSGPVYFKALLPPGTSACDFLAQVKENGQVVASVTDLWKRTVVAAAKAKDVNLANQGGTPGIGNLLIQTVADAVGAACPVDDITIDFTIAPTRVDVNGAQLTGSTPTHFEFRAGTASVAVTFAQNTNMTVGLKSGSGTPKSFFLKLPTPPPAVNPGGAPKP